VYALINKEESFGDVYRLKPGLLKDERFSHSSPLAQTKAFSSSDVYGSKEGTTAFEGNPMARRK
jgi:hypothetical protein